MSPQQVLHNRECGPHEGVLGDARSPRTTGMIMAPGWLSFPESGSAHASSIGIRALLTAIGKDACQ